MCIDTFPLRGVSAYRVFSSHHMAGSHVPHKGLDQAHATCTPDTARTVSRFLPSSSQGRVTTLVLMPSNSLSTRQPWFTFAHLLGSHLTRSCPAFSSTLTTMAFDHSSLRWFEASPCRAASEGLPPSFVQLHTATGSLSSPYSVWDRDGEGQDRHREDTDRPAAARHQRFPCPDHWAGVRRRSAPSR